MTERTYSTTPQNATPTHPIYHTVANNPAKDVLSHAESVEEEPYTIKCICDYTDDDGNTIYCDMCDTWQHIECFYHGNVEEASREDFKHSCADCDPKPERDLDKRKATERQRQQRHDRPSHDTGEKKTKRPPSKSHKKKPKPSDVLTNGYNHDHDAGHSIKVASPHDHSHGKKLKSHRSHHSISNHATKRSPPHISRIQPHGHPLSPATTPPDLPDNFRIHSYSSQLQQLYGNDSDQQQIETNTFAALDVSNTISQWLHDPDKLRTDTGIDKPLDVFNFVKAGIQLDTQTRPELDIVGEPVADHPSLNLRSLVVVDPVVRADQLIGELNGMVGFQRDYTNEESERYSKLCHPAPFVFFHPRLPLYIDTRREGSQCRYIRRSCRPNSTLDTYITNQTEYHFCVTNDRPLAAREKVTLAWDFRFPLATKARFLYLLNLSDEEGTGEADTTQSEYQELTELIDNVLSDYGGCACGLGADCAFVRFHRYYHGKTHTNGLKSKKGRKPKQHISPNSTGHATNSRDVSEGRHEMFEAEDDTRSTSGSTRSKPRSRDMTPIANGVSDLSTEVITEREKRKLANYEKTFEKMDQEQPPRKKKRNSDGAVSAQGGNGISAKTKQKVSILPGANPATQLNGTINHQYRDASTSRQHSSSPTMAQSPAEAATSYSSHPSRHPSLPAHSRQGSVPLRSNYSHASTQTDEVQNTWFNPAPPSRPKKKFVSLSQRIIRTQQAAQAEREARRRSQVEAYMNGVEGQSISHASSPEMHESVLRQSGPNHHTTHDVVERPRSGGSPSVSVEGLSTSNDTVMTDMVQCPSAAKPTPPSWPGVFAPPMNLKSPTENRSSELRVQMPPIPSFLNSTSHNVPLTPGSVTPSSVSGSFSQSPFGTTFPTSFSPSVLNSVGQHPSPVKKKLSLKDYRAIKASAGNKNSTDSNSTLPTLNSSAFIPEESKGAGVLEASAVVESPASESVDPITVTASDEALPLHESSPAQRTV